MIHFGRNNPGFSYTMGGYAPAGAVLESVVEEKDVGVMVHNTLKPSAQCAKAAKKANQVLGQMARAFHYRDKDTWIKLYKTYVRCHQEYAVQAWSPWTQADKELLEAVQKRAVRMVSGLRGKEYEDRLKEVGLTTLEARRQRGDMIRGLEDPTREGGCRPRYMVRHGSYRCHTCYETGWSSSQHCQTSC